MPWAYQNTSRRSSGQTAPLTKSRIRRLFIPLIERFHAAYNDTVVIGDGINDIMLAKNTGVLSCALLNGLTHRDILLALDPDFAFEGLRELIKIFQLNL